MRKYSFVFLCLIFFALAVPVFAQDGDQDGFPDSQDACPNQPAPQSNNGCPPIPNTPIPERPSDQDGDGMIDSLDNCPLDGGPAQNTGCPINQTPVPQTTDGDGDGFPDGQDACPNQAGSAGGCDIAVFDEDGDCVAATKGSSRVNIREAANENATVIGQLLPNQTKLVLGITVSSNTPQNQSIWLQVDIGFINTSVIRIGGNCGDIVSDDEGEPRMTGTFALEYDCSTTPRVIIVSDETPTNYLGRVITYSPWWVYPDVLYEFYPRPTEPDVVVSGNVIIGTPCDDLIIGTNSVDIIDGLGGNDMIIGLLGYDALVGNLGNDQLFGMTFTPLGGETFGNILIGGDGNDRLHSSGSGVERLDGGNGDDILIGNGADQLRGGNGNDTISGSTYAIGGAGDDNIRGTSGDDRLYGNSGNDRIDGLEGHDTVDGGDNDDWLFGNLGDDILNGGNGRDFLRTHLGNDQAFGGEGDDNIEFYWGGTDIGEGNNGNDRIDIRDPSYESLGLDRARHNAELGVLREGAYFSGGEGNDIINAFRSYTEIRVPIRGDNGNDSLRGGRYLEGGNGDDFLLLASRTEAHGGEGNDSFAVYRFEGAASYEVVLMYGEGGNDRMIGNSAVDLMFGGEGNDYMVGGQQTDYLNGGNGDDVMFGGMTLARDGTGRFYVDYQNYLDSGSGRDTVDGGQGGIPDRTHADTCLVDSSDIVTSCEVRTWPSTFVYLIIWQPFFDMFGI